jgi:diadenosine tetraphosphatase ApaH/serine/threonine PP2A family protein phosphatase
MRVAALYDVHAMPWALEAVLRDLDADAVVIGGDFLGGPCEAETVALIRALDATVLRGNAENDDPWGSTLPLAATLDDVVYCHATPTDNLPLTTAATPDEAVAETFAGVTGTVVIGHSHHQFDRRVGALRVVNAGSVGMPYEGEVAAFWALVEDGEPRFRRTPMDVERAVVAIRASGWTGGEEFIAENLLQAPDREEAIAVLEARRCG